MSIMKIIFVLCVGLIANAIAANHERHVRRINFKPWRTTTRRPSSLDSQESSSNDSSIGCGVQASGFQPTLGGKRVINGKEAKPHSWPWTVVLLNGEQFQCGGSLLRVKEGVEASDIVLTAAHCIGSPSRLSVAAGRHRRNVPGQYNEKRQVSSGRKYPKYGSAGNAHDIALLKLASPIKFTDRIRPVCLPQQGAAIPTDLTCVAAGWGRNSSTNQHQSAEALQQLVMPVHPPSVCSKGWQDTYKQDSMICAGSLKSENGVCHGDSGSMLACKEGGRWVQHGVVSFGVSGPCMEDDMPDVFARVSSYVDWLKKTADELTSL